MARQWSAAVGLMALAFGVSAPADCLQMASGNAAVAPTPSSPPSATIPSTGYQNPAPAGLYLAVPGVANAAGGAFVYVPLAANTPANGTELKQRAATLPAGTRILLSLLRPIDGRNARQGDPLYFQSKFPVIRGRTVVLPAGVYAQGQIDAIHRRLGSRREVAIRFHLTRIILPDNRVLAISPAEAGSTTGQPSAAGNGSALLIARNNQLAIAQGTTATLTLQRPLNLETPATAKEPNAASDPVYAPWMRSSRSMHRFGQPGIPAAQRISGADRP